LESKTLPLINTDTTDQKEIAEIAVIARNPTPAGQEQPDLGTPVIAVIGKAKSSPLINTDDTDRTIARSAKIEGLKPCSIPLRGIEQV